MNGRERGFLLLSAHLGDPSRKVLSSAQLRKLAQRVGNRSTPLSDRELIAEDIMALGYGREEALRIVGLLADEEQLLWYVQRGQRIGCVPITRVSQAYPPHLRACLGLDSPGCLWAKGDLALLKTPMISLVGSRDLRQENLAFAEAVGKQAALQGYTLVSGNARGADIAAQDACLDNGGKVISVVADRLSDQIPYDGMLYLSENGYDQPFSAHRALSRNRVIHCLGRVVLIAQCTYGSGGTWDGTVKNLRHGWRPVYCFDDGSKAATELAQMGAALITADRLRDLGSLKAEMNLFDQ